jgi:hypothetical protein
MSLRHAMLGLIAEMAGASGYDLLKVFKISLGTAPLADRCSAGAEPAGRIATPGVLPLRTRT